MKKVIITIGFLILLTSCISTNNIIDTIDDSEGSEQFQGILIDSIDGVFLSEQTGNTANGDPCYYLLRFFEDGVVLQTGICGDSFEEDWRNISQWFHRDSPHDMARGRYILNGDQLTFEVTAHFNATGTDVTLEFKGEYKTDKLILNLYSKSTGNEWLGMEFIRLDVE